MRSPTLSQLPPPPPDRTGWPWTEESPQLPPTLPDGSPWPRLSIVMPSFNRLPFIEESLRSVLLQGYPDLEVVAVDGGSRDGTVEILERYGPWLASWVSEPDRGWRHAVNKGFARCSGQLVTFFSSDDLYLPGTFGTIGERWPRLEGAGAVVGAFFHVDERSRPLEREPIPPQLLGPTPLDLSLVDPRDWRLHQVATFYAASALDAVGRTLDEDLVYNADRELLYRVCRRFAVDLVDQPLAAFRIHRGSLAGAGKRRFAAELEYARMQLGFCAGNGHDRRRRRIARHFLAKAQISFAKYGGRRPASMLALLKALWYQPSRLWTRGYLKAWLGLLGPGPARPAEVKHTP